jgi:hypothetical protein
VAPGKFRRLHLQVLAAGEIWRRKTSENHGFPWDFHGMFMGFIHVFGYNYVQISVLESFYGYNHIAMIYQL